MDTRGVIANCNRVAETIFAKSRDELIDKPVDEVIPEHLREIVSKAIQDAVTARQVSEFEVDLETESGRIWFLAVVLAPVEDDQNNLLGLAAWLRDITQRKKLQRQLLQAEKLASLGTLASGVAHHFNNIFGGVATFADYALQSDDSQTRKRALQMIGEAASRVSQITQSLLTFAEKDMRHFDLFDLTEVVLTFIQLVEKPLSEKHISLDMHIQAVPSIEVPGSRMHQVLGNLLDNAEKAIGEKEGSISIRLEQIADRVVLYFADSGCGISSEDLPHIFEPFYTGFGVVSGGDHPSAGLGLSVVHGILRELGAEVDVTSEHGKGAEFRISFPIPTKSR